MSNSADATIDIKVNDDTQVALSRILGNVRALGASMGATSKSVDKATSKIGRSLVEMASTATHAADATKATGRAMGQAITKTSPYARSIAMATSNLAKYEAQVRRLSSATQGKNGQFYTPGFQGSISKAEMATMDDQIAKRTKWATELQRLQRLEDTLAGPTTLRSSASRTSMQGMDVDKMRADAEGMSRSVRAMRKTYSEMWGDIEAVNGRQVFPPSMFRSTQEFTKSLMEASNASRYLMYDVSRNLALAGAGVLALGAVSIGFAAKWERSFADVARTTGATGDSLDRLRVGLASLSTSMPVSFTELAEIAALGAQMGIAQEGIVGYTETVAKLIATTNLSGDAAGKALGRFQAFYSDTPNKELAVTGRTFSNLASSILKVGVNSVATETGIVNVSTQIASMARYAGMSADQTIGLAGALSSVGVPPELSRGVITRLFTKMGAAVMGTGGELGGFAKISGRTAEEFRAAWNTDEFGYVFTDFIAGLREIPNESGGAVKALQELGITGVRDIPVLMRLAGAADSAANAGGLLAQTMNDARDGWYQNTTMALQYAKINDTLVSRIQVLGNAFQAAFASIGGGGLGPIKELVSFITDIVTGFNAMSNINPTFGNILTGLSLVGGGILLLGGLVTRIGGTLVGFGQALQAAGFSAAQAAPKIRALGLAIGAFSVVTAVVAVVAAIAGISAAADAALNPVTDLNGALEAMRADTDAGSGMVEFSTNAGAAAEAAAEAAGQAGRMGDALGIAGGKAYGASGGIAKAGDAAYESALKFGDASSLFLKNQIANNEEFAKMFEGSKGADYSKLLTEGGFDMDTLIEKAATGGEDAVHAYMEAVTGFGSNTSIWDSSDAFNPFSNAETQAKHFNGVMSHLALNGVSAFETVANGASVLAHSLRPFSDATEATGVKLEEFKQSNIEAFEAIGKGMSAFVAPSSLIGFTQQLQALEKLEPGEEREAAAQAYQTAWQDAYGGAAFSLTDYMRVFQGAANEQQKFYGNLQTLIGKGVDQSIIEDLAAMGPEAQGLVQALVDGTQPELDAFVDLYGKTGFDAMVALAANQEAARGIVTNVMAGLGVEGARKLSEGLASGLSLEEALAAIGRGVDGLELSGPTLVPKTSGAGRVIDGIAAEAAAPVLGPYLNAQEGNTQAGISAVQDTVNANGILGPKLDSEEGNTGAALNAINAKVVGSPITGPKLNSQEGNTQGALSSIQGKVNGSPIKGPRLDPVAGSVGGALGALQGALIGRSLSVRVNAVPGSVSLPSVPQSITAGFAKGGYTGNGGKYDYAGDVHRGEFVMTKEATQRIGVGNLYAMMRQASSRQPARGVGFAGGGYTGGNGSGGSGYTELSPRDRALLERLGNVALFLDGNQVASSVARRNFVSTRHGQG